MSESRVRRDLVPPTPTGVAFTQHAPEGRVEWYVDERPCAETPGARGATCLVFQNNVVMRRVYDFPRHWRSLSDEELLAVSWRR